MVAAGPINPTILRLLVLRALFQGVERRDSERVTIGEENNDVSAPDEDASWPAVLRSMAYAVGFLVLVFMLGFPIVTPIYIAFYLIVEARVPEVEAELARQIVGFVQALRREDLEKKPGVAESLDWARALLGLGTVRIDENLEEMRETLMCLLKTRVDQEQITQEVVGRLVAKAI